MMSRCKMVSAPIYTEWYRDGEVDAAIVGTAIFILPAYITSLGITLSASRRVASRCRVALRAVVMEQMPGNAANRTCQRDGHKSRLQVPNQQEAARRSHAWSALHPFLLA